MVIWDSLINYFYLVSGEHFTHVNALLTFPCMLSEQSSRAQPSRPQTVNVQKTGTRNDRTTQRAGKVSCPGKKSTLRDLTTSIYYVQAILCDHVLRDVDILPLQGLSWQTNVVSFIFIQSQMSL